MMGDTLLKEAIIDIASEIARLDVEQWSTELIKEMDTILWVYLQEECNAKPHFYT